MAKMGFGTPRRWLYRLLVATVAFAVLAPGPAAAQAPPSHAGTIVTTVTRPKVERDRSGTELESINSSEIQAYACILAGGGSLLTVSLVGAVAAVATITGAPVAVPHPVIIWSALTGTLFASVCAAAAVMAPGVIRMWDYYYLGMRPPPG
jgi:hypothetical protein